MPETNKNILEFPKGFLWGVSTSAHQIEGGLINDWSRWEKSEIRVASLTKDGKNPEEYISGSACDSYNRYEEDAKLVEDLNCGAYRFGLEWARIEPNRGEFNKVEIAHYRKVLENLKSKNLKTVVTLWHWTMPTWLADLGGWSNPETIKYYLRYVELVVSDLGDLVDYWVTLNEPTIHIKNGYISSKFPPNQKNIFKACRAFKNLAKAHNEAYTLIHENIKNAKVGITSVTNFFEPARPWCLLEIGLAKLADYLWNGAFLDKIKKSFDYIGVDYYFHDRIIWRPPFVKNKNERQSDLGWEIYPKGIYHVLKFLGKFKKPIIVMENGLADKEDRERPNFIREHLQYVHQAIAEGAPVIGYFHWSLLDNFEWAEGFWPKFGLYEVDRKTFARKARPSAKVYREICGSNSLANGNLKFKI